MSREIVNEAFENLMKETKIPKLLIIFSEKLKDTHLNTLNVSKMPETRIIY